MSRHPVETLWREVGLPEYFLGNGGTNTKLYELYDRIRGTAQQPTIPITREAAEPTQYLVDQFREHGAKPPAQQPQVPCPVCGGEAIHALDVLKRTIIREPIRWDANDNRSYEPVETLATEIYSGFVYDGPAGTTKPNWTPGGNGLKQDEARYEARRRLRIAGHSPSVPSTEIK